MTRLIKMGRALAGDDARNNTSGVYSWLVEDQVGVLDLDLAPVAGRELFLDQFVLTLCLS